MSQKLLLISVKHKAVFSILHNGAGVPSHTIINVLCINTPATVSANAIGLGKL